MVGAISAPKPWPGLGLSGPFGARTGNRRNYAARMAALRENGGIAMLRSLLRHNVYYDGRALLTGIEAETVVGHNNHSFLKADLSRTKTVNRKH